MKKFEATTDYLHYYPIASNLDERSFKVDDCGRSVCVSDLTYIMTAQGWLYLTVIINLADWKVIG